MATYYIDLENGNDSNNGTSFAQRRKTIESFKDADAAGDEYRIMASPDPTLVGSCTMPERWAFENYSGNTIDWDNSGVTGQIAFSTSTGQTQITRWGHALETGDTIFIKECMITNADLNGTWEVTKVDNNNFKIDDYTSTLSTSHTDNSSGNMGKWIRVNPLRFKLASAVTQSVASTGARSAWTASSNVTAVLQWPSTGNWDWGGGNATIEHVYSDKITIDASFGTGKAAYWATGTLDLSGYQQISLMIAPVSGAKPASSNMSLRLCTDTSGDTSVHTIPLQYTNGTNDYFIPNVKDFGANLNSAIKSVAIYVDTDEGAQTFKLCNIIACKASSSADSLTHRSLIGLNTTNDPFWYAIACIVGKRVILYHRTTQGGYPPFTYYDLRGIYRHASTGDTQNLYKREPILIDGWPCASTAESVGLQAKGDFGSGTVGNEITFSGGWNRTDMSSKATNGMSWFDNQNASGRTEWQSNNVNYSDFGFVRFYQFEGKGYRCKWTNMQACNLRNQVQYNLYETRGCDLTYTQTQLDISWCTKNNTATTSPSLLNVRHSCARDNNQIVWNSIKWGTLIGGPSGGSSGHNFNLQYWQAGGAVENVIIGYNTRWNGNSGLGLNYAQGGPLTIDNLTVYGTNKGIHYGYNQSGWWEITNYNHSIAAEDTANNFFQGYTGANYGLPPNSITSYGNGDKPLVLMNGTTVATWDLQYANVKAYNTTNTTSGTEFSFGGTDKTGSIKANKWDGTTGNDFFQGSKGKIIPETTIRKTASGKAWKMDIAGSAINSANPLNMPLAKVAVNASALVTAKLWCYRDGTGVTGGLKVLGNPLIGVSEATALTSGSAGAWEEVSLTFTPSTSGFVEFEATCYYVSNDAHNLYIDDITITQA